MSVPNLSKKYIRPIFSQKSPQTSIQPTRTPQIFTKKKTSISHKLAKHTNIIKHPQTLQPPLHTPHWQKEYVVKSTNVTGLTRQGRVAFLVIIELGTSYLG
jgi:hypothetical protein